LLAVPDSAIAAVAGALLGAVGERHVVLHLSGRLGATALAPLASSGAGLGSLHPLLSFADPAAAPARLRAAVAAIEGDERGRAVARTLAICIGLTPFEVAAAEKARYHAGAVFGANFLVTIAAVARRVFTQAGVPPEVAAKGLATLMAGVLENVTRDGPAGALTGPLKRGDAGTVRANIRALDPPEAELYRVLSRATLDIAGLDAERRAAIERALDE